MSAWRGQISYAIENPAAPTAREGPGEGGVDSGTENTSLGYWARLLPVAQKIDNVNLQEIFIQLSGMFPR